MQRMHVSETAGVTTYRVWITMQMDGEDGSVRTDNGWMGWMDSEDGFVCQDGQWMDGRTVRMDFFVRTGNRWVDGEEWWMVKMHLCEDG